MTDQQQLLSIWQRAFHMQLCLCPHVTLAYLLQDIRKNPGLILV